MHGPIRMALAALGLGVLWAGPPARAMSVDAQGVDAHGVDVQVVDFPPDLPEVDPDEVGKPSGVAAQLAGWVTASGDNGGRPFAIVDKAAAHIFVFRAEGRLVGAAPVLVGSMPGDDAVRGVGDRDLAWVRPDARTTPAGRFVAGFGPASGHRTVLWVDYADAVSLHPVITTNPAEMRLERMQSPIPEDHRITYGCINVPAAFYEDVVLKAFLSGGIVYVLPDTKPLEQVFPAFAAQAGAGVADGSPR